MAIVRIPAEHDSILGKAKTRQCVGSSYVSRYLPFAVLVGLALYVIFFISTSSSSSSVINYQIFSSTQQSYSKGTVPAGLRSSNEEIVQKASMVDITYKDVTRGKQKDPHRGAQDQHGNWGYVADEKSLRQNPPQFNLTGGILRDACNIRDSEFKMIDEKVAIDPNLKKKSAKILCIVQTSGHRHADRVPALRRTWGPKCDGFVVASNVTDRTLGTVRIPVEADEINTRKWLRVRTTCSYIYDNYFDEYDWFFFSNDMVFLLMENLRLYLESDEIQTAANYGVTISEESSVTARNLMPIFLGRRFALGGDLSDIFNAAPVFVINKAALKLFIVEVGDELPVKHTAKEDLMIARSFRQLGVYPYDTQDETGKERFMLTSPGNHYDNKFGPMYHKQSIDIQHGIDHCSERSISFHYVSVELMYRLYALLYKKCPS